MTDVETLRRIADDSDLRKWSDDAEALRAIADRLESDIELRAMSILYNADKMQAVIRDWMLDDSPGLLHTADPTGLSTHAERVLTDMLLRAVQERGNS